MLNLHTRPLTKIISIILAQVFLCANIGYPADNLRVPIGSGVARTAEVLKQGADGNRISGKRQARSYARPAREDLFDKVKKIETPQEFQDFDSALKWILDFKEAHSEFSAYAASYFMSMLAKNRKIPPGKSQAWVRSAGAAEYALRQQNIIIEGVRSAWGSLSLDEKRLVVKQPLKIHKLMKNIFVTLADLNKPRSQQRLINRGNSLLVMKFAVKFYGDRLDKLIKSLASSLPEPEPQRTPEDLRLMKKQERIAGLNQKLRDALKRLIDTRNPRKKITWETVAIEAGINPTTYWIHKEGAGDIESDVSEAISDNRRLAKAAEVLSAIDSMKKEGVLRESALGNIAELIAQRSGLHVITVKKHMSSNKEVRETLGLTGQPNADIRQESPAPETLREEVVLPDIVILLKKEPGSSHECKMLISRGKGHDIEARISISETEGLYYGLEFNRKKKRDIDFVGEAIKILLLRDRIKTWLSEPVDFIKDADKGIIENIRHDERFSVKEVEKGGGSIKMFFYEVTALVSNETRYKDLLPNRNPTDTDL